MEGEKEATSWQLLKHAFPNCCLDLEQRLVWNQQMGSYFDDLKIQNQFVLVTSASISHWFAKNGVREEIKEQFEEKNGKKGREGKTVKILSHYKHQKEANILFSNKLHVHINTFTFSNP